jgi:transposase
VVRCRRTLVHQRTEWQQRMHSVLYHHGVPRSRKLLTLAKRERIAALTLPAAAREQLTIALEMIDAIEVQSGPVDLALRAHARTQPGCRALIDQIYGLGPLTSVTLLAELGDTRRFQNSRDAVRSAGLDITFYRLLVTGGPIDEPLAEGIVELVLRGFAPTHKGAAT